MSYRVNRLSSCRSCGSARLRQYLDLPDMPLTDQFLTADQVGREFLFPVTIFYCEDCWLSQTQHDVDAGEYYIDYRYTASASPFARRFMQRLGAEAWSRYAFAGGDSVVEVGSGDGTQLTYFQSLGARVFGFEPSAPLADASRTQGVPVANRLFDGFASSQIPPELLPLKAVLLTYTFDHLPDPTGFLKTVAGVLDPERGVLIIEVHDLAAIMERREFCLFAHEHAGYYSAATMQRVLDRAGFDLLEVGIVPEAERRGNSLLVSAARKGSSLSSRAAPPLPLGQQGDPAAYEGFGRCVTMSLDKLRAFIRARREQGITLAGYGAGGRGVMTLAAAAKPGDFQYVCDLNPAFHGFYTPGAHVPVAPPERLLSDPAEEVVVFSFGYFDEIREQLSDYRARGGKLHHLLDLL